MNLKTATEPEYSGAISQQGIALINFCTSQSAPCAAQSAIIEVLSNRFKSQVPVKTIDIDEHHRLGHLFQITSIPTLILFRDGREISRFIGFQDLEPLSEIIRKALHS